MNSYQSNQKNNNNKLHNFDDMPVRSTPFENLKKEGNEQINVYMKTKSGSVKFQGIACRNPDGAYVSS